MEERIFYIIEPDKGLDNYVHVECVGDFMEEAAKAYDNIGLSLVTSPSMISTSEKCGWCEYQLNPGDES